MNALIQSKLLRIKDIMHKHGVIKASLFGSAATDTMTDESDIDFLVNFDSNMDIKNYADNYFGLIYALEDLLEKRVEITVEKTLTNPYLIKSINNQKINFYDR